MTEPSDHHVKQTGIDDSHKRGNDDVRFPSTLPIVVVPLVVVLGYLFLSTFDVHTGTDVIGVTLQALIVVVLAGLIAILFDRAW